MLKAFFFRRGKFIRRVLNKLFFWQSGGENRPVFHDPENVLPELRLIDENYDTIHAELMALLDKRARIPRYHEVNESQAGISDADSGAWRVFYVSLTSAGESLTNRALCPRTAEIVDRIPNLLGSFFSILDPGKSIPAHNGPYLGYLRYHTAFVVPSDKPPRIRIKDRWYTWKEGESVFFDDSWNHEVENESDGIRVVLITDVIRPMPGPLHLLALGWERYKLWVGANFETEKALLQPAAKDLH